MIFDLLVIASLGLGLWLGWQRGLWLVAADIFNLLVSLATAGWFYQPLGQVMSDRLRVIPPLSKMLAFALIALTVNLLIWYALRHFLRQVPPHWWDKSLNRYGGAAVNGLKTLLLIAVALVALNGLPLTAAQKEAINSARLPQLVLSHTGKFQQRFNAIVGRNLQDTLNFFTIKNTSKESVDIGFKTTTVKVNEAAEWKMLELVNRDRRRYGLAELSMNLTARPVARAHSRDMFARGYFAHINPDGLDPFDRMQAGGVRYSYAGENLAYAPTVFSAHEGLMNSPGHRANILRPEFKTVGIGVIDGGPYGQMFTQNFTD